MASRRQVILVRGRSPGDEPGLAPMGTLQEVTHALSRFNTAPDGATRGGGAAGGMAVLYGPGMVVEIPTTIDRVLQAMVTLIEEEMAFPVLMRACKSLGWKMMDPESGRMFG